MPRSLKVVAEDTEGDISMKYGKCFLTVLFCVFHFMLVAQVFTDSNLPIVVIETDNGIAIPDEPKVLGTMKIIYRPNGARNYLTDIDSIQFLNYNGRIGIESRGSTSQEFFDKKPYALETLEDDGITNSNVCILGMPKENDWILNSLAFDETGLRDVLAYELSERLGQYAPRRVYCEVMVNGDYKGLYVFMEKIKQDKNRVDIAEIDASCNAFPEVTGGYITKADKANGDPVAWSMQEYGSGWWWGTYTDFIHHYPKPENVTNAQNNYIHSVFTNLAAVSNQHNISINNGISSVIDIPSFVNFMMIAEFSSNVDVYSLSTFFHKDRKGKLRAGPVWDYNLAFGYDAFGNRSRYDVWQFNNQDNNGPKFWRDLFETDLFRCYLAKRWNEITAEGQPLNYDVVCSRIDEIDALITEAIGRDNQRWHQMQNHASSLVEMKQWLRNRINWINQNIGSYGGCADIDLPPLVISKIHYHPLNYWGIDGDRLEFIEITNNGFEEVDLSGVYFRELGCTYSFPFGSSIQGYESLVLCSDSLAFIDYYSTLPFGQYTRNLSNKSENLVLADAWGNIIDEVHYLDSLPWPIMADGGGPYLELIDLNLDNSLPENWTLGYDLTKLEESNGPSVKIYPNPVDDLLMIEAEKNIVRCQVLNMSGILLLDNVTMGKNITLDTSRLTPGIYVLKLHFSDDCFGYRKIVKK